MRTRSQRDGFTLVELLMVIVVIAIMAALLLPAIVGARKKANLVACSSNMHQMSLAWMDYRYEHNDFTVDWLSSLYPDYQSSKKLYICPADKTYDPNEVPPGDGSKPQALLDHHDSDAFDSTDDFTNGCYVSYFYEMCAGECPLGGSLPNETWAEYKRREMQGMDLTKFPVIRCYHHWDYKLRKTRNTFPGGNGLENISGITVNVAFHGNVFLAPENWKCFYYDAGYDCIAPFDS